MIFDERLQYLVQEHNSLTGRKNSKLKGGNGIFDRYRYPIITNEHTPLFWRYDLNRETNPYLMERMGVNCTFNPGAIELGGTIYLVVRLKAPTGNPFLQWLKVITE